MTSKHGHAEVVRSGRQFVVVRCPFCKTDHAHKRESLGSAEVVAHCGGVGQLLTYSIPKS